VTSPRSDNIAGHKNALYMHNSGHKTGQKWQIGFEASCEAASVARNSRSALLCVSKHRSQRDRIVRRIGSEIPFLVGHPGLEPGAEGLRTQRLAGHKALFVSDSDTPAPAIAVTKGHHATYSGHRDRLDRAGLLRAIARAREAKVMAEDDARTLVALVELVGGRLS
jgi:hypothetical protein